MNLNPANKLNMAPEEVAAFYDWMERYAWTINGTPVKNLLKAMRGYKKRIRQQEAERREDRKDKKPKARKLERLSNAVIEKARRIVDDEPTDDFEDEIYKIVDNYISDKLDDEIAGDGVIDPFISEYCPKWAFTPLQRAYMRISWGVNFFADDEPPEKQDPYLK